MLILDNSRVIEQSLLLMLEALVQTTGRRSLVKRAIMSASLIVLMPMVKTPGQLPNATRLRGSETKIRYIGITAMASKYGIRLVV